MILRLVTLAGAGYAAYRAYQARSSQGAAPTQTSAEPDLSPPDPKSAVMPDGAEANDAIGARTIGRQ
jgi:threonine/homoserine/homoserine lactone efflux protein